jgi:streptogramin lyase
MKLPLRRPAALLAASVATLAVALPATALAKPHAKEYPLDTPEALPGPIVAGRDGDLWYASDSFAAVGRIDLDG